MKSERTRLKLLYTKYNTCNYVVYRQTHTRSAPPSDAGHDFHIGKRSFSAQHTYTRIHARRIKHYSGPNEGHFLFFAIRIYTMYSRNAEMPIAA